MSDKKTRYELFYERFHAPLQGFFYKRINDRHIAEDLTEEVFERAWKAFDSYDSGISSEETWLYCIAKNRLKNYYRDKKTNENIDDYNGDELTQIIDYDKAIYLEESRRRIALAMNQLSDKQKKILVLSYYNDMSLKEIALKLGMSYGSVRAEKVRGLKKLTGFFDKNNWEY